MVHPPKSYCLAACPRITSLLPLRRHKRTSGASSSAKVLRTSGWPPTPISIATRCDDGDDPPGGHQSGKVAGSEGFDRATHQNCANSNVLARRESAIEPGRHVEDTVSAEGELIEGVRSVITCLRGVKEMARLKVAGGVLLCLWLTVSADAQVAVHAEQGRIPHRHPRVQGRRPERHNRRNRSRQPVVRMPSSTATAAPPPTPSGRGFSASRQMTTPSSFSQSRWTRTRCFSRPTPTPSITWRLSI